MAPKCTPGPRKPQESQEPQEPQEPNVELHGSPRIESGLAGNTACLWLPGCQAGSKEAGFPIASLFIDQFSCEDARV